MNNTKLWQRVGAILCAFLLPFFLFSCSTGDDAYMPTAHTLSNAPAVAAAPAPVTTLTFQKLSPKPSTTRKISLSAESVTTLPKSSYNITALANGLILTVETLTDNTPFLSVLPQNATDTSNTQEFYPRQIAIVDPQAPENPKIVCTIQPIDQVSPISVVSLDGKYVYLAFTPLSETVMLPLDTSEQSMTFKEYELKLAKSSRMLLQINMQTATLKQYPVKIPGNIKNVFPISSDLLLLQHVSDVAPQQHDQENLREITASKQNQPAYEYMDILDINSGKLTEFYAKEPQRTEKFVELSFITAVNDRIYFMASGMRNGNNFFGFRVYDSNMSFIDGRDLETIYPDDALAEMSVQSSKVIMRIYGSGGWSDYYQFMPVTGGYKQEPFAFSASGKTLSPVHHELEFTAAQISDGQTTWLNLENTALATQYQVYLPVPAPPKGNWNMTCAIDGKGDFFVKTRSGWAYIASDVYSEWLK